MASRVEGENERDFLIRDDWNEQDTSRVIMGRVKAMFCFAANSRDWWSNRIHYEAYSSGRQYLEHACSC